jgi:hypothetical protein
MVDNPFKSFSFPKYGHGFVFRTTDCHGSMHLPRLRPRNDGEFDTYTPFIIARPLDVRRDLLLNNRNIYNRLPRLYALAVALVGVRTKQTVIMVREDTNAIKLSN